MNTKRIIISIIALFFVAKFTYAQTAEEARKFIPVFLSESKEKKILKDPYQQTMPFIALKFRTGSTGTTQIGSGKNVERAAAFAVLEGIDSTLIQSITDEFYKIFISKLSAAGVKFVDVAKIKATEKYKEFLAEKPAQRKYIHKEYGNSTVYSQNNEPIFDIPANGFKMLKYQTETGGGIASLHLTVDFVEFDVSLNKSYNQLDNTVTTATANIQTAIKISSLWAESVTEGLVSLGAANSGGLYMSNDKMDGVLLACNPIYTPYNADVKAYDESIPEFAKSHRLFGGRGMELGTFVVTAEKEAYKKAALDGLSKYADYIVAIIKSYNEGK
jgi:hypothetical protein